MYQRLAVVTVTHCDQGRTVADGIVRGIVAAEIKRQDAKTRAEIERYKTIEADRDRRRDKDIAEVRRYVHRAPGPLQPLQDAWALVAGCALAWGELLGDKLIAFGLQFRICGHLIPLIEEVDD